MIIVTGGAGFIGSNLVKGLNQMGEEKILIVDHLSNASKHLNLNRLRYSDYLDKKLLLEKLPSLPEPKVIFHQGACSDTTESDGRYMMDNNYEYSKTLLHYAMDRKIPSFMLPALRSTAMEPTVFPRSLSRNIPSTFTVSPNFPSTITFVVFCLRLSPKSSDCVILMSTVPRKPIREGWPPSPSIYFTSSTRVVR